MKKTVEYKGYQASVEYDDGSLFVKILHIDDLLIAEIDAASDAPKALEELVESYLLDCEEEGRDPRPSFKGSFNVRVAPDLHRRAAICAADQGMSLNKWIVRAIENELECLKLSDRIDGVISKSKSKFGVAAVELWFEKLSFNELPKQSSQPLHEGRVRYSTPAVEVNPFGGASWQIWDDAKRKLHG